MHRGLAALSMLGNPARTGGEKIVQRQGHEGTWGAPCWGSVATPKFHCNGSVLVEQSNPATVHPFAEDTPTPKS